ncbi:MAG: hypothetical protein C0483_18065 [Pirellula sp.]|nr:hypothetical protein [Pirellula sp.]
MNRTLERSVFNTLHDCLYVSQNGNDLYVNYQAAAVSEPGSMLLVSIAGLLTWLQRRWRKKQAEAAAAQ